MTDDLLAGVRLPGATKKKKLKEPEPEIERKPIKQAWTEFNDNRTVDDSLEGCKIRLAAIDKIIEEFQEWLGTKKNRVITRMNGST